MSSKIKGKHITGKKDTLRYKSRLPNRDIDNKLSDQNINQSIGKIISRSIGKASLQQLQHEKYVSNTRTDIETILLSTMGQKIFMHISINPCTWVRQISREVRYPPGLVAVVLRRLVNVGLVSRQLAKNRTIFFPTNMLDKDELPVVTVLAVPTLRKLYIVIHEHAGITLKDSSQQLGIPIATLKRNVNALVSAGLIGKIRDGKLLRLYPSGIVEQFKQKYSQRHRKFLHLLFNTMKDAGLKPYLEATMGEKVILNVMVKSREISLSLNTNPFAGL